MKKYWQQLINHLIKSEENIPVDQPISDFQHAKAFREFKIYAKQLTKEVVLIFYGIFSVAFGLKSFLLPNNFIDGGATGIALLLLGLTSIPLYLLILITNILFVVLGYNIVGELSPSKQV